LRGPSWAVTAPFPCALHLFHIGKIGNWPTGVSKATECPVSFEMVDEKVARGVGLVVVAAVVVFISTPFKAIAGILAIDFFLRAFVGPKVSPLARNVRRLTRALGIVPRPTDAAPKRFAAGLGFVFSCAALGLWLGGLELPASVAAAVLGGCAALEGFLGYCIGCRVYSVVKPLLPARPHPRWNFS
jgi:hypothetical protein